jgi:hypothetical protein
LSAPRRQAIGIYHDLAPILSRSPGCDKLLVLDSAERLDAATLTKLDTLLHALAGDKAWRLVLISQFAAYEDPRSRRLAGPTRDPSGRVRA